jgi:hypothetical protein
MSSKPRIPYVTIVAWALLLLGSIAVAAAVVLVYPRDVQRPVWYTLFALAVVGALAIRSGVSLLRRPPASRASDPARPAV